MSSSAAHPQVQIILVQSHVGNTISFRIAKLIHAVKVEATVGKQRWFHVGDVIDEAVAENLSDCRNYEVTVTEKPRR